MATGFHPYSVRGNRSRLLRTFALRCLSVLSSQRWCESSLCLSCRRDEIMSFLFFFFLQQEILKQKLSFCGISLVLPIKQECWQGNVSPPWACCCGSVPAFSITVPAGKEDDQGRTLPHVAETCFACSDFPFFSSCQQQSIEQNVPVTALGDSL